MSFLPHANENKLGWSAAMGASMLAHGGAIAAALAVSISVFPERRTLITPQTSSATIDLVILDAQIIEEVTPSHSSSEAEVLVSDDDLAEEDSTGALETVSADDELGLLQQDYDASEDVTPLAETTALEPETALPDPASEDPIETATLPETELDTEPESTAALDTLQPEPTQPDLTTTSENLPADTPDAIDEPAAEAPVVEPDEISPTDPALVEATPEVTPTDDTLEVGSGSIVGDAIESSPLADTAIAPSFSDDAGGDATTSNPSTADQPEELNVVEPTLTEDPGPVSEDGSPLAENAASETQQDEGFSLAEEEPAVITPEESGVTDFTDLTASATGSDLLVQDGGLTEIAPQTLEDDTAPTIASSVIEPVVTEPEPLATTDPGAVILDPAQPTILEDEQIARLDTTEVPTPPTTTTTILEPTITQPDEIAPESPSETTVPSTDAGSTTGPVITNPPAELVTLASLIRNIRAVPPRDTRCALALPRRSSGAAPVLSLIGADLVRLNDLSAAVLTPGNLSAKVAETREPVDARQCPVLDAVRVIASYPANRIGLLLPQTKLNSGDTLQAEIVGAGGLSLAVMVIDDNGVVQDLSRFAQTEGDAVKINAPVARSGPTRGTRQILLVIGSTPDRALSFQAEFGQLAQDVFGGLDADLLRQSVFGLATFDVQ